MASLKNSRLTRSLIGIAAAAAITAGFSRDAKATYFVPYFFPVEQFNLPTTWTAWDSAPVGNIYFQNDSGAKSAPSDALLLFGTGGSTSDFLLIDKQFSVGSWSPETSQFYSCDFQVALKPTLGAKVFLQILSTDYYYLASSTLTLPPSSAWTNYAVTTPAGGSCPRSFIVRIGVNGTTHNQSLFVDDVAATTWYQGQ